MDIDILDILEILHNLWEGHGCLFAWISIASFKEMGNSSYSDGSDRAKKYA